MMKLSSSLFVLLFASPVVTGDASLDALRKQFLQHSNEQRHRTLKVSKGPSVHVSNRLYIGKDQGKSCGTAGKEFIEANVGDDVVYCFKVTNDGYTPLNGIKIANKDLDYEDTFDGILPPGKSVAFTFGTSVVSKASTSDQVNHVTVTANPTKDDGSDLADADDVVYTDTSAIAIKSPYTPEDATSDNCLQDSWLEANPGGENLVCSEKHAFIQPDSITTEPKTCVAGETIRATLNSVVTINKSVFDLGWYIAADGGDGLSGSCSVNGLRQENYYAGMNSYGFVSFEEEGFILGKPDDKCGDVAMMGEDGFGYEVEIPLGTVTLKCADDNENGSLDARICFTWSDLETDQPCTLSASDPNTQGKLPDLYPGAATGSCYCTTYDIPAITVTKDKACL